MTIKFETCSSCGTQYESRNKLDGYFDRHTLDRWKEGPLGELGQSLWAAQDCPVCFLAEKILEIMGKRRVDTTDEV